MDNTIDNTKYMFRYFKNTALELKCVKCNKCLSVAPIFYSSKGYTCGRCHQEPIEVDKKSVETVPERQILFESIAEYLLFPCSYEILGCQAELKWTEVTKHESACCFRNTICPLSDRNKTFFSLEKICSWRGNSQQQSSHLISAHQSNFINPPQVLLGPEFRTMFFFTEVLQQVMMIIIKYCKDQNEFRFYVMANLSDMECNLFRYQVEVHNETRSSSVVLRSNKLDPLGDHIFKDRANNGMKMEVSTMKEILKNTSTFFIKFGIVKKNKKEIKILRSTLPSDSVLLASSKDKFPPINEGILQELECPVCNDFMVPPIFICQAGHSVCDNCNEKVVSCPTCRGEMLKTRNFTLEKLTGLVNYPCKNRTTGCYFVSSADKIRNHERNCQLTGKDCILKCSWKGNTLDMMIHLTDQHTVFRLGDIKTVSLGPQRKTAYEAILFDDQVFLLTYTYAFKNPFQYSLQYLSSESNRYKFEMKIIDRSKNNLNLCMCHMSSLMFIDDDKKSDQKFSLPYDLIQPIIHANKELNFKIDISKLNPNTE